MIRILLRAWNGPGLVILVAIGIALQTSLFSYYPFLYLQPDIVLLAVIWCALRRSFVEGGIITLIISDISEIHSASPQGVFLISYMCVYLLIRLSARYILLQRLSSLIALTLFASIFWKLSGLLVLDLLGVAGNQWRHTIVLLLPGAVMQGVVGIWVYRLFERFDHLTFKDPKSRDALEEELQLDEEGL